jgi:16S rRNA (adenine1518-N6/adenine1519-N6)-dimethyltransferase
MKFLAKKSLGQHFLTSKSVLAKIIEAADLKMGEEVLEIGPGTGILTEALLKTGVKIVAVEKDDRAFELMSIRFAQEIASGSLKLVRYDILEFEAERFGLENGNYAIVANIPYYITGAILEKFLEHEARPNRMVLLVQKEVADRIVARPSSNSTTGKESILSVSVKAFGAPKIIANVPPGAFNPPPTVDSAILLIENISGKRFEENVIDVRKFFEIVRAGFAHKRKFLIRNLESVIEPANLKRIWIDLNLNEKVRAEDLEVGMWFEITAHAK